MRVETNSFAAWIFHEEALFDLQSIKMAYINGRIEWDIKMPLIHLQRPNNRRFEIVGGLGIGRDKVVHNEGAVVNYQ